MSLARLGRALIASPPLLLSALVAKLWLTGTLGYYINSRTVWIVLMGAALFAIVGLAAIRAAWQSAARTSSVWRSLVFAVPVLLGLILPANPLSSTTGQASSFGSLQQASHLSSSSPGDAFGYWVGQVSNHPDHRWWVGRRATLVGFVSRQNGLPRRSFLVGRFLVTCCVVDASLLGFPVQLARGRIPVDGSWVEISGVFERSFWTDPNGSQWPLLKQARTSPVTIPSNPYLSP